MRVIDVHPACIPFLEGCSLQPQPSSISICIHDAAVGTNNISLRRDDGDLHQYGIVLIMYTTYCHTSTSFLQLGLGNQEQQCMVSLLNS
jgi:hypothetical protein